MSLPESWVDRLFGRLAVRYGREWMAKWEGLDIGAVKADWAAELSGFQQQPAAIAYGLDHLPIDRPPTVHQFRDVCRRAPVAVLMLEPPAPKLTAEEAAKIVGKLHGVAETIKAMKGPGDKQWAQDLKKRVDAGWKMPIAHHDMMNDALNAVSAEAPPFGSFTTPPPDVLPPGMRGGQS